MKLLDYFEAVDINQFDHDFLDKQNKHAYYHIDKNIDGFETRQYKIALLGIEEERNTKNKGTSLAPDKIREQLYKLNTSGKSKIIDLGNLRLGKSLKDTYIAISDIVFELIQQNIIPVVIGGSQDLTYGIYMGYNKLNQAVNLVTIDPKLDLGYNKNDFDSESYLGQLILDDGKNLFNYTNLGYQSYYCSREELKLLNKMNFEAYRLGQIRSNMQDFEPVLRDANILSLDIRAIKQSDAPAHKYPSPNGFYSEEICQLARYAGISDKLSTFGIFELNPNYDFNRQTCALAAQIIWYFIDGVNARQNDFPQLHNKNYTKFIVSFERSDQNITFYQNKLNKRWWMEVASPQKKENNLIVACTFNDYEMACNQEIPDRWLKTLQKLN